MSAYKKLNQQDAYISTYVSRKSWIASGSQYRELGINNIVGLSGSKSSYVYSVDNVVAGNSQVTASSAFNRRLIYDSISHLYYKDFTDSILVTSSSYESYLQSSYEVSGSRYLYNRVAIFSLPKEMYGTNIEPLSVSILPDFISSGSAETGSFDNYVHNNAKIMSSLYIPSSKRDELLSYIFLHELKNYALSLYLQKLLQLSQVNQQ